MPPEPLLTDVRHITIADKILIHLFQYVSYLDAAEVPFEMSQEGIAHAIKVQRSQVSRALKTLLDKGYVDEQICRIKGAKRRRKGYFLQSWWENTRPVLIISWAF